MFSCWIDPAQIGSRPAILNPVPGKAEAPRGTARRFQR
jgi:hypothetical protein